MIEKILVEYLRLSIEDGDIAENSEKMESDSISHQRDLIARYRKEKKLFPGVQAMEIVDDGYSGTNFDRPGMCQLLSMARNGQVFCIIVKDISRFGRNYLEVGDYLEQIFPFLEIRFISVNDGYDSDDYLGTTGGIEVAFRSLLYDMYSRDLSAKMYSALEVRRKRGDYIGPRPPFGYCFSEDKRSLVIDKVAAQYVKRIFELACMGYTTGKIAVKLNEENIPTPGRYKNQNKTVYHMVDGKGYWARKSVLKILENRVYLGTVVGAKYKVTKIGGKQFKRISDEDRIYVPGRHEAIVTEEVFLNALSVIQNRGNQKGKRHNFNSEGALKGKLKCGKCGKNLVRISCTVDPCYICERAKYDKSKGCFDGQVNECKMEEDILGHICQKIQQEAGQHQDQAVRLDKCNRSKGKKELSSMKDKKEILKAEKRYLYERYKAGQMERNVYLSKIELLREAEGRLCEQALKEDKEKKVYEEQTEKEKGCGRIEKLTRELVEQFVQAVYVNSRGQIDVIWKDSM